ncbi:hypothetical protein Tco_1114133 [Tanacetum coccineum]|uniref:Uncharacterized protein n=1 Tax=Tanacetum coccineum TaxID=301880 RepID=A0ABQ5IU77_9ASTR
MICFARESKGYGHLLLIIHVQLLKRTSRPVVVVLERCYGNDCLTRNVPDNIDRVVSKQDELPSSVELDFGAELDGGRMYPGHLEAMRLP